MRRPRRLSRQHRPSARPRSFDPRPSKAPRSLSGPCLPRGAAGAPERLRCSRPAGRGSDDLEGEVDVRSPGRVRGERPRARSRAKPGADPLTVENERGRRARLVRWPRSTRKQRAVSDADGRNVERRAQVEGETCTSRMVSSRGVHEQHFGTCRERPNGKLQESPFSQRKQPGLVRGRRLASHHGEVVARGRGGPASIARSTGAVLAALEADEARAHASVWTRSPDPGIHGTESPLHLDELFAGARPRAHIGIVTLPHADGPRRSSLPSPLAPVRGLVNLTFVQSSGVS